jgi:hypothetical protein
MRARQASIVLPELAEIDIMVAASTAPRGTIAMMEEDLPLGRRDIDPLVLRALVRKLVDKGLLSEDDVRTLLFEAARGLAIVGGTLSPQATRDIVNEDLIRPFLGNQRPEPLD